MRRSPADGLFAAVVAISLLIAVTRVVVVGAAVPGAVSAHAAAVETAKRAGASVPASETVYTRLTETPQWLSWWGGRIDPFRQGGDYLGVISHSSPSRTIGSAIGVEIERLTAKGVRVNRVLVPRDETALFGRPPGAEFTRPDGSTFLSAWAPVARYVQYLSAIPAEQSAYDPVLSDADYRALAGLTKLKLRSRAFYTGAPVARGTATWILVSRAVQDGREFFLIPLETLQAVRTR
jgi:hypothetical protein